MLIEQTKSTSNTQRNNILFAIISKVKETKDVSFYLPVCILFLSFLNTYYL